MTRRTRLNPAASAAGPFVSDRLAAGFATLPRWSAISAVEVLATGTMLLAYLPADKTQLVSAVTVRTGTTAAAATPTVCRIGLFLVAANGDITPIASTANDTTLFAAASTSYTKSFSTPVSVTFGDRLAVGILVVSGATMPTMRGASGSSLGTSEVCSVAPRLAGTVTGLSDLPSSLVASAGITNISTLIYARLS